MVNMAEQLFHVGVKAFILNKDGKVLLMEEDGSTHRQPQPNYWDLPGGRIDENETTHQALAREIKEELGVTEIGAPEFNTAVVSNHRIPLADGTVVSLVLMVYKVTLAEGTKIELSDEHAGYEWATIKEAKARLQNKYPKEFTDRL
jgi:8-oxo-dGTP pyrophosphatase MutT (NUDIX family)